MKKSLSPRENQIGSVVRILNPRRQTDGKKIFAQNDFFIDKKKLFHLYFLINESTFLLLF
jgi:hypothetical protein